MAHRFLNVFSNSFFKKFQRVRTVDIFDPVKGEWNPGPPMDARYVRSAYSHLLIFTGVPLLEQLF